MKDLAAPSTGERGTDLLLRHLGALTSLERPSAYDRLEEAVGSDLAQMLVAALSRRERIAA